MIGSYSRLVVGRAIADDLRIEFVIDAFDTANWRDQPVPVTKFHRDHGSQHVARVFRQRLRENGLIASISSVSHRPNNDAMETWFATLQR